MIYAKVLINVFNIGVGTGPSKSFLLHEDRIKKIGIRNVFQETKKFTFFVSYYIGNHSRLDTFETKST